MSVGWTRRVEPPPDDDRHGSIGGASVSPRSLAFRVTNGMPGTSGVAVIRTSLSEQGRRLHPRATERHHDADRQRPAA